LTAASAPSAGYRKLLDARSRSDRRKREGWSCGGARYVPIDEDHPLYPESSYALSKTISEEMARQFSRTTGTTFAGLRISSIMVAPGDYERLLTFQNDPRLRKWNLWGYVDARDMAPACRLALEADLEGAEVLIVAADTVMERESRDLMAEVYPEVPLRDVRGRRTLLSIEKARRELGYSPKHSWRENILGRREGCPGAQLSPACQ
jgi:nucleoside-diphosphate-sugar epimerase